MNKPVFFMAIWLLALTALPVHAFAACALNKALYRPMEKSPDNVYYELTHSTQKKLRANQADLVLTINSPNDSKSFKPGVGRSYDYGFAFSNGYRRTHLLYAGESAKSTTYDIDTKTDTSAAGSTILYFDDNLRLVEPLTTREKLAPKYLLMPGLGPALWYANDGDRRFVPPEGLWKLALCANPAR